MYDKLHFVSVALLFLFMDGTLGGLKPGIDAELYPSLRPTVTDIGWYQILIRPK
jgi:hypothetical protein